MSTSKIEGVVKFFKHDKGFGFITDKNGRDTFVHITDIKASGIEELNQGDKVRYERADNKGRTKAKNIELI